MVHHGSARAGTRRRTAVSALTGALLVVLTAAGSARGATEDQVDAAASLTVGKEVAIAAARPGNVQVEPAVAWNGSVYFVVWQELTPFVEGSQIYGARVSPSGKVLDPGGILLNTDVNPNRNAKVAAGNGRFLVVWEEDRSPNDIRGALVNGAGTVLRQWFVSTAEDEQADPDVAWNGRQFFVAWSDQVDGEPFDIYGTRVRWSGRTLDGCNSDVCDEFSHGISINASAPGDQFDPTIAAIRTGPGAGLFFLTWTDQADPADHDLRGARLTNGGVPLDGTGFLVSDAAGAQSQSALGVNGRTVLGAWADQRSGAGDDIFAASFRPTGQIAHTPTPFPAQGLAVSDAAGDQTFPSAARRGTGFLVAWADARAGNLDIVAARISARGANLDPGGLPIAATPRNEGGAALATGSSNLLVAYARDAAAPQYEGRARVFLRLIGTVG